MKKKEPVIDYDTAVGPQLLQFLEHSDAIIEQSVKIQRHIDRKQMEWGTKVSEFKRETKILREEVTDLQNSILEFKNLFMSIVNDFKQCSLDEDLQKLKKKLDSWNLEHFMTRAEFKKLFRNRP